jgi:hypothetical protein
MGMPFDKRAELGYGVKIFAFAVCVEFPHRFYNPRTYDDIVKNGKDNPYDSYPYRWEQKYNGREDDFELVVHEV